MTIATWDFSNLRSFKSLDQCRCLNFLHWGLGLVRVTQLCMWVASPGEAVSTRIDVGGVWCTRYYKSLVSAADDLLDEKVVQGLHSLRQRVFDHSSGSRMMTAAKAVCWGHLPSFLFGKTGCDHLLATIVLLDRRDPTFVQGLAANHSVDALRAHATTPQTALLHVIYFILVSFDLK